VALVFLLSPYPYRVLSLLNSRNGYTSIVVPDFRWFFDNILGKHFFKVRNDIFFEIVDLTRKTLYYIAVYCMYGLQYSDREKVVSLSMLPTKICPAPY